MRDPDPTPIRVLQAAEARVRLPCRLNSWDATFADDGVRYVQAALAYPAERKSRWHTLKVGAFGADGPLLLWSANHGFAPHMHGRWSGY